MFMLKIDLNLLRVFEALYELRSVTRSAERLGLTQSAVSHALSRLRDALGDPLFVRHPGGLQPTALAMEIAPGVREGLDRLRGALMPASFDPASAARRFRIVSGVYFSALLIPELIARVREAAPHVTLSVGGPGTDLLSSLDNGTTDIALGAFGKVPPRLVRKVMFREDLVWIARRGSELLSRPELLASYPADKRLSVAVGRPFPGHGAYSWENGLERLMVASAPAEAFDRSSDMASTVHDALTAIATVARTDLIALVPRRLAAKSMENRAIAIIAGGLPVSEIDMAMLWHTRLGNDQGLRWLREQIVRCLQSDQADGGSLAA
jgi:DNA-binding transcriptional LysR family regulator